MKKNIMLKISLVLITTLLMAGICFASSTVTNLNYKNAPGVLWDGDTDGLSWKTQAVKGWNKATVNINLSEISAYNPFKPKGKDYGIGLYSYLNIGCDCGGCVDAGICAVYGTNKFMPVVNANIDGCWLEPGVKFRGKVLPLIENFSAHGSNGKYIDPSRDIQLILESTDNGFKFKIMDLDTGKDIWNIGEIEASNYFTSNKNKVTMRRITSLAWGKNHSMEEIYDKGTYMRDVHMRDAYLYNSSTYTPWIGNKVDHFRMYPDKTIADWFLNRKLIKVDIISDNEDIVSLSKVD